MRMFWDSDFMITASKSHVFATVSQAVCCSVMPSCFKIFNKKG